MRVRITEDMKSLLLKQNVAVVATVSPGGVPNLSLKGVVKVEPEGFIYFMDLYRGKTRSNLLKNQAIALTVFSIDRFKGYQFKGRAEQIDSGPLYEQMVTAWQKKKRNLVGDRIIKNVRKGFSGGGAETHLPDPKYLVKVKVEKIYNLVPRPLRD
jgi:predicted pyridoxine 5'-phosphate oxidase superfamily flavin-nucleotide-binding protein